MAELLLHSMAEFREVIFGIADAVRPRHVVEIGAESGRFSRELLDWCAAHEARLTTIDPAPAPAVQEMAAASAGVHQLLLARSPAALADVAPAQLYIIDGDHNYHTVSGELRAIHGAGGTPVVLLHDVCWPCARRDTYYSPTDLPLEHVHPHTYELGVDLDSKAPFAGGFRSEGVYALATHEGGPRNGVLTAVEDFLAERPGYKFCLVPAVFGLGVLFAESHPQARALAELLRAYDGNPLIARLEENRLRNYLRVIALQDALQDAQQAAHAALQDGQAERELLARAKQETEQSLARLNQRWYTRAGAIIDAALKPFRR